MQFDLLRRLHRRDVDRHLRPGDHGHQLRRLLLLLRQLQLDLLPGLHDRDVDVDLHREPGVHLLDLQHQLSDVLPRGDGVYLERHNCHLHWNDCPLRVDHQFDVVWLPVWLLVADLDLHGNPHAMLVAHRLDVVLR